MGNKTGFSPLARRALIALGVIAAVALIVTIAIKSALSSKYDQLSGITAATDECVQIPGISQAEDIAIDGINRRAFITGENEKGRIKRGIYRIDFDRGLALTYAVPPGVPVELHPHGLALYTAADGRQSLFVVNHPKNHDDKAGHSILIFDVSAEGSLTFSSKVDGTALFSPNDVAPVGPRQFYVTNDAQDIVTKFDSPVRTLWMLLNGDSTGNVVFYDGEKFRNVAEKLRLANGINTSRDAKYIYVAESFGPTLLTYERNVGTNALALRGTTKLPGAPDNVDVTPDGHLLVAIFPRVRDVLDFLATDKTSPRPASAVLELTPRAQGSTTFDMHPVWLDDGSRITTVTIGAAYNKAGSGRQLLLGSISTRDDYMLACGPKGSQAPR